MSKFEGARSISSAQYYDRDEDDMPNGEVTASDIARKLAYTARSDLSNVKEILSDQTKKVTPVGIKSNGLIVFFFCSCQKLLVNGFQS